MLKIKNRAAPLVTLLAVILLGGCRPPGPAALLAGKRLFERGKPEAAIEQLQSATAILKTNALAWSYLGVAYQQAGLLTNAVSAYEQALKLDRNLVEIHFNLGCALLDLNRVERAKLELSTYTMLRSKDLDAWLKLGTTQLRLREIAAAERSFLEALKVRTNNPVALNGIGLVQMQRNRSRDAVQCFSAAVRQSPVYPPALRNLAVVSQTLGNRQFALDKYRAYTALKPRPADADAVLTLVRQLEGELAAPPPRPLATNLLAHANLVTNQPKVPATNPVTAVVVRQPAPKPESPPQTSPPKPPPAAAAPVPTPPSRTNIEVVRLPDQPVIRAAQDVPPPANTTHTSQPAAPTVAPLSSAATGEKKAEERGFFSRLNPMNLLRREPKPRPTATPLPPRRPPPSNEIAVGSATPTETGNAAPVSASAAPATAPFVTPSTASAPSPAPEARKVPRYTYRSPAKPQPGNREDAQRAFAQGVQSQRAERLNEAIQSYSQAAQVDPGFFEAWYNLGLAAHQARRFQQSLAAYETALAIEPTSADARYNFALVLRDAGYWLDVVNELEKLLAASPEEARAHFALGNLFAQKLREPQRARPHYLKVLEVEPRHPQAASIRYWLAANPG